MPKTSNRFGAFLTVAREDVIGEYVCSLIVLLVPCHPFMKCSALRNVSRHGNILHCGPYISTHYFPSSSSSVQLILFDVSSSVKI